MTTVHTHVTQGSANAENGGCRRENPRAISRICIEGLFGQYDYELPARGIDGLDLSRLFLMYGENGSGKTTLLKMIYHALAPEDNEGHRTFLAQTRFDRFALELYDGTVLEANRKVLKGGGSLQMALHRESRTLASVDLDLDEKQAVSGKSATKQPERYRDFLTQLRDLQIRVYYLSDDRQHQGHLPKDSTNARRVFLTHEVAHRVANFATLKPDDLVAFDTDDEDNLQKVMGRVVEWVRHQVRRGAAEGQGNVYLTFSKVVHEIAKSANLAPTEAVIDKELIGTLVDLERQSELYSRYGLTVKFPVRELVSDIMDATPVTHSILYNLVKGHVEGVHAKLKALEDIYLTIDRFIATINSFYRDKKVHFNVDSGFTIRSSGEQLNPALLSSGERQLFLLFCNTLLARKHASLFLIDEPELSLNVKWQRKLVQAVLDNTEGTSVQFLMATHSVELISQHNDNVVTLRNLPRPHRREELPHGGEA